MKRSPPLALNFRVIYLCTYVIKYCQFAKLSTYINFVVMVVSHTMHAPARPRLLSRFELEWVDFPRIFVRSMRAGDTNFVNTNNAERVFPFPQSIKSSPTIGSGISAVQHA